MCSYSLHIIPLCVRRSSYGIPHVHVKVILKVVQVESQGDPIANRSSSSIKFNTHIPYRERTGFIRPPHRARRDNIMAGLDLYLPSIHRPGNEPTNKGHASTCAPLCAPLVYMSFYALGDNGGGNAHSGERNTVRRQRAKCYI